MNSPAALKPAFQLKGSLFTISVLQLFQTELTSFAAQLANLVKKAPKFFEATPIILDLDQLPQKTDSIDFPGLIQVLHNHGLRPVGVRGGTDILQTQAQTAGLTPFANTKSDGSSNKATPRNAGDSQAPSTLFIDTPVRSGQQVYARHTNLVVLSSVGHAAEVLADGDIHIFGALRGRALAGISGNTNARIFCHQLKAELVSIAGRYILNDAITADHADHTVQIFLDNESLRIQAIDALR